MSNQKFTFLIGLPGSGKSTWLKDNSSNFEIVSADNIKERTWNKGNNVYCGAIGHNFNIFCESFHEESINIAENHVYEKIQEGKNIILDGGGINRSYNIRIINKVKEINPEIEINAIYFNTPVEVCLKRIKSRERVVPIDDIYKKNQMLPAMLQRYKAEGVNILTINYFTDKYVFFDLDGTLCSINDPVKDINGNLDFVNTEFFLHSKPIKNTLDYYHQCVKDGKKVFILTACPNNIALIDKRRWANKHLQNYMQLYNEGNFMWVGNKDYKHIFLQQYLLGKKIKPEDVLYIDDTLEIVNKMRTIGVHAQHVSQI